MSRTNRRGFLNKGVTLAELIIAVILLSVVVLTVSSIDRFSRFHLATSQRRAELQNLVSYVLEHMSKNFVNAIGNEKITGANSVVIVQLDPGSESKWLFVVRDLNNNGRQDLVGDAYAVYYYSDPNDDIWWMESVLGTWEGLGTNRKIANVTFYKPVDASGRLNENYVDVSLTACWDPNSINLAVHPDGTPDNPCVTMSQRMKMPSVSTN